MEHVSGMAAPRECHFTGMRRNKTSNMKVHGAKMAEVVVVINAVKARMADRS